MKLQPETNEAHSCLYAYGKIRDVTLSGYGEIRCRRCNKLLKETQVNPETLAFIKRDLRSKER